MDDAHKVRKRPRSTSGPAPPPQRRVAELASQQPERSFGKPIRVDVDRFKRGTPNRTKVIEDKKLKSGLQRTEELYSAAATSAAHANLLLTEETGCVMLTVTLSATQPR